MKEVSENTKPLEANNKRREFLKNSGKAAAVAPAISLLLAAGSKPAAAQETYDSNGGDTNGGGCGCGG